MNYKTIQEHHYNFLIECLPSWKSLQKHQIHHQQLQGGLFNLLIKFNNFELIQPQTVILRIFGPASQSYYLDKDRQNTIIPYLLAEELCPKIYGANHEMRVEQFILSRPLECRQILNDRILTKIGSKLQKLHSVEIDSLDHTPFVSKVLTEQKYINKISQKLSLPLYSEQQEFHLKHIRKWLCRQQFLWLNNQLMAINDDVVLSHNDFMVGNILLKNDDEVMIIDYELCAYNYRTFDVGSYFSKVFCDFNDLPFFDPNGQLPSENEVQRFATSYFLSEVIKDQKQISKLLGSKKLCDDFLFKNPQTQKSIDKMVKLTPLMILVGLVFFGITSVNISKLTESSFDFIRYCRSRMDLYYKLKNR